MPSKATAYRTVLKICANANSVKTKGESWERRVLTGKKAFMVLVLDWKQAQKVVYVAWPFSVERQEVHSTLQPNV